MRNLNKAREVVILTYCPLPKCLFVLLRIRTGGCPLGTESDNFEAIYYDTGTCHVLSIDWIYEIHRDLKCLVSRSLLIFHVVTSFL